MVKHCNISTNRKSRRWRGQHVARGHHDPWTWRLVTFHGSTWRWEPDANASPTCDFWTSTARLPFLPEWRPSPRPFYPRATPNSSPNTWRLRTKTSPLFYRSAREDYQWLLCCATLRRRRLLLGHAHLSVTPTTTRRQVSRTWKLYIRPTTPSPSTTNTPPWSTCVDAYAGTKPVCLANTTPTGTPTGTPRTPPASGVRWILRSYATVCTLVSY